MNNIKKQLKSYTYTVNGYKQGFSELNMRIHLFATVCVLGVSAWLGLSLTEWAVIFVCIGSVLTAELFNTAIERVCNNLRDDLGLSYGATRDSRDIAAAAVLTVSLVSVIVGLLVLGPKLAEVLVNL